MRTILFVLFSLTIFGSMEAQKAHPLLKKELALRNLSKTMIKSRNIEKRTEASYTFHKEMKFLLQNPISRKYPFDSLLLISRVESPDKRFRIFTWELSMGKNRFRHFGLIQIYNKRTPVVISLNDYSDDFKQAEDSIAGRKHWYGAFYYNILLKKSLFGKKYYLFGWDLNDGKTYKKVVDVLLIKNKGLVFGSKDFVMDKKRTKSRHIIEYKYDAVAHLNYDPSMKMIIYDHLIPLNNDTDSEMVPDGSYEGFKYKGGQWHYVEKVFHQKLNDGQAPIN